ncbi:KEOPS complex subunit Pcc1 [Halorussus litoreus]|uniref:KEOPS complex subunit Pcc1 n=1 Tax=Halorussus litoreus TaxID=1710536 RepID=UPI000E22184C|nr:KEOPS complex subunit Pcc1 [Halorussus litoreus]
MVDSSRDSTSERQRESAEFGQRPHDARLRFEYESSARARVIARSVRQEVGEIDGDRSAASVARDGDAVVVRVGADDLVALRAGCNTWGSLVEVAERTTGLV